jgi:hypothetical protein
VGVVGGSGNSGAYMPRPRSLSPQDFVGQDFGPFGSSMYQQSMGGNNGVEKYNPFETAIWSSPSPTGLNNGNNGGGSPTSANSPSHGFGAHQQQQQQPFDTNRQLLEGLSLGLNAVPYRGQYQHLLVAN